MLGFVWNRLDPSIMYSQAYDEASNMSGKINEAAARKSSQYPSPFTPIVLFTVWTWQLWLHLMRWASVTWLVLWNDCQSFFAHPKHQKKLEEAIYRTRSQNRTCWSSTISAEQDGLNGSTLSIISRNFTPPLLLVLRTFQLKVLACGLLTRWQMPVLFC